MTPAAVVPEAASSSSTANAASTANAPFFSAAPGLNINLRACLRGGFPSEVARDSERDQRRSGSGRSNSIVDERDRARADTNFTPHSRRRKKRLLWRRTNSSHSTHPSSPSPTSPVTSNDEIVNANTDTRAEENSGRIGGINLSLGRSRKNSSRATLINKGTSPATDAPNPSIAQQKIADNDVDMHNLSALNHHRSVGEPRLNIDMVTSSDPLSPARGDRSRSAPPGSRFAASVLARASFRSNSSSSALPPRQRKNATLRRMRQVLFERVEPRFSEDLRSTKRRIIQVSRQSHHSPAQCQLGFRSRTGWEPIRAVRENQDCLVALLPWGPQAQYCLFGVLDGHGRSGHLASLFVAQRIVSYLLKALKRQNKIDVSVALFRAYIYAEQKLESSESKIDCTLSGSTSVFVLLDRSTLYCANVGDSRAVLGRRIPNGNDGLMPDKPTRKHGFTDNVEIQPDGLLTTASAKYHPVPLSFDHKPSRPDEKARIENEGGRVDAWQNCDVGAERVWLKDSRTPGLAVTRSFGDYMVKNIGVNATPEIYSLPLSAQDSFVVLGSDGVYEFLSNEEVVNIVAKHRENSNGSPQTAAEEIVKISAERWMDDDTVIDDISCIVVFLEVKEPKTTQPLAPTMMDVNANSALEIIQTPASSRMNSIRPNSNQATALFGQFSTTSSRAPSRQTSNGRFPVPLIRPEPRRESISSASELQNSPPPIISASAVNDAVRKYAQKLAQESNANNGETAPHRISITREEVFGTKVSSSVTAQSMENDAVEPENNNINNNNSIAAASTSSSIGVRSATPKTAQRKTTAKREREEVKRETEKEISDEKAASIGSDTEMYDEDAATAAEAAVLQGHVSDASSRFGDAEDGKDEHIGPLRITQSMSTKVLEGGEEASMGLAAESNNNIYPSDEEDEDKYADADTLVPIDNQQKVVTRREVETHRRRLFEASTPNPLIRRKESTGIITNNNNTTRFARKDSNNGNNNRNTPEGNNDNDVAGVVRLPSQQFNNNMQAEEGNNNSNNTTCRSWFSRNIRSRRGNKTPPTADNDEYTTNNNNNNNNNNATREESATPRSRLRR